MKFVPLLFVLATGICFGAIKPILLVEAARSQIGVTVSYDPTYQKLSYPGGDVPIETGVCTDVIVRALRSQGIDLQKEVHQDMTANFEAYPRNWGLKKPDRNIDHRRVPNLMTYFKRFKVNRYRVHGSERVTSVEAGDGIRLSSLNERDGMKETK